MTGDSPMSKHNNVNPDHYKVAGRERPGKGIARQGAGISNRQAPSQKARGRQRHPPIRERGATAADSSDKPRARKVAGTSGKRRGSRT
jgi:hypothetical protein